MKRIDRVRERHDIVGRSLSLLPSQVSMSAYSPSFTSFSSQPSIASSPLISQPTINPTPTLNANLTSIPTSPPPSQTSQPTPTPTPTPTPPPPSSCDSINTCKPKLDTRTYKVMTLRNSLRVLLSKSNTTK